MFLRTPAYLMLFLCSVIILEELEAKSLQKNQQVGISKYSDQNLNNSGLKKRVKFELLIEKCLFRFMTQ